MIVEPIEEECPPPPLLPLGEKPRDYFVRTKKTKNNVLLAAVLTPVYSGTSAGFLCVYFLYQVGGSYFVISPPRDIGVYSLGDGRLYPGWTHGGAWKSRAMLLADSGHSQAPRQPFVAMCVCIRTCDRNSPNKAGSWTPKGVVAWRPVGTFICVPPFL